MTHVLHEALAAFVGIDWADAKHAVCLQAAGSAKREGLTLEHTPEAIEAWVATLRTRFHGHPIAICLELNKGPLISALRQYDFLVLFPLNPLTLARYREAFTPSRAKDDPTDAALQRALLRTPRQAATTPATKSHHARARATRRTPPPRGQRHSPDHQPPHQDLKHYFPQVLQGFQDKDTRIFCDFLSRWPTLKAAQLARRSPLETCFHDRHVRSADVIAQRLHAIKTATPLTLDEGVSAPHALRGQALVNQLRVT